MRFLLLPYWVIKSTACIVLFLTTQSFVPAQQSSLQVHSKTIDTLWFNPSSNAYMEIPPWTISGGWFTYFQSSFYTKIVSTPASMTHPKDKYIDLSNAYRAVTATQPAVWKSGYVSGSSVLNAPWKKNYNGVFTAQDLHHPKLGNYVVAYSHGEHKNERVWSDGKYIPYQNQIIAIPLDVNNPSSFSGFQPDGSYYEHWDSYFGFINANWIKRKANNGFGHDQYHDIGPVLWPSNGLVDEKGNKASWGLRHPSSIVEGDYLYLYYMDTSGSQEPGRKSGFKVARVHLDSTLIPTAYKVHYRGNWNTSLPSGFTKENLLEFSNKKGAPSSRVTPSFNGVRFSVAKIKDKNFWLAVEQHMDEGYSKVVLRISDDLIRWSDPILELHNELTDSYHFSYPIFLDKTGHSNTVIDLDDFFILGQTDLNKTVRIRLRLSSSYQTSLHPSEFDVISHYDYEEINVIYPVPAGDQLHVHYHSNFNSKAEIRDAFGTLVWDGELEGAKTNLSVNTEFLGNGLYYLIVGFENRREVKAFTVSK